MVFIIAGLLLLWLSSAMIREFVRANPAALAKGVKQGGGVVVLFAALFLLLRGQVDVAIGLAGLGFWMTSGRRAPSWASLGRKAGGWRSAPRISRVRSALIEMELDHASGAMNGSVVAGPLAGQRLDSIDANQLRALHGLCLTADPEGARLLEAYFDCRFSGWRSADKHERDARSSGGPPGGSRPGSMSKDEAYELLGLPQGASREEIARAHRRMMKKFHPDHGGSTDMAARINEAKDVLMHRHP